MEHFNRAHYDLNELKDLLKQESTRVITLVAQKKAFELGFLTNEEIVNRCLLLEKKEIYKTMTSNYDSKLWQDVYKTLEGTNSLYIKLQKNYDEKGVVISFKVDEDF